MVQRLNFLRPLDFGRERIIGFEKSEAKLLNSKWRIDEERKKAKPWHQLKTIRMEESYRLHSHRGALFTGWNVSSEVREIKVFGTLLFFSSIHIDLVIIL